MLHRNGRGPCPTCIDVPWQSNATSLPQCPGKETWWIIWYVQEGPLVLGRHTENFSSRTSAKQRQFQKVVAFTRQKFPTLLTKSNTKTRLVRYQEKFENPAIEARQKKATAQNSCDNEDWRRCNTPSQLGCAQHACSRRPLVAAWGIVGKPCLKKTFAQAPHNQQRIS